MAERLPSAQSSFRPGDIVVITGKGHPHYGEAGVIEAPTMAFGMHWVVKLNGAYSPSCGVLEEEIRRV